MVTLVRDTSILNKNIFDLVVIGGGIFGACAIREAASRGLRAVLIEKEDFSHGTSANHFKMVHGGIRYIQHGDIVRIRESCRERSALLRIAPHMVKPLPILIPTYGWGKKSKIFLSAGMLLYDALTLDRNHKIGNERRIPISRFLSVEETLRLFPGIEKESLTGAAVLYDGQMVHPPRLSLSFIKSAVAEGAFALNHCEAVDFLLKGEDVVGVKAKDKIEGEEFEIRSRFVLNAAGPWAPSLVSRHLPLKKRISPAFSRDLAFVVNRKPKSPYAIAVPTKSLDKDILMDRGGRHLFIVPWKKWFLVGVWHQVFEQQPEEITLKKEELSSYIKEVNEAYPGMDLDINDVLLVNTGLTLFGNEKDNNRRELSFGKRSLLIDHEESDNLKGLMTLIGVRATTARGMAEKAVKKILKKLKRSSRVFDSEYVPVWGGRFFSFNQLVKDIISDLPCNLQKEKRYAVHIAHFYGNEYGGLLGCLNKNGDWSKPIGDSAITRGEILYSTREEMVCSLADVVFRRTDLAAAGGWTEEDLKSCAEVMAGELGWDEKRMHDEMNGINGLLPTFCKQRSLETR